MVRNAATVALETSLPVSAVDAAGDQDVVDERDQHRDRVLGLEADRDVGRDHQQAEDDRDHARFARSARRTSGRSIGCRQPASPPSSPNASSSSGPTVGGLVGRDLAPGSGRRWRRTRDSSVSWILAVSTPSIPPSMSASRTSSTEAGSASATWIRVPDSKSMPRLSCLSRMRSRRSPGSAPRPRRSTC